jgi:hypothetical protein
MTLNLPAGWAFPPGARKAHFFPKGETDSLCGGYGFQMVAEAREPDNGKTSPDDCTPCRRKLDKATG